IVAFRLRGWCGTAIIVAPRLSTGSRGSADHDSHPPSARRAVNAVRCRARHHCERGELTTSFPHTRGDPPERPANSKEVKTMSNLVVRNKSVVDLDGFNDLTDETEGDETINVSSRVIQGTKLKFIDPDWLIEGCVVTGMLLTVIGERNVVNKW